MFKAMFGRILHSSKVQVTFLPFLAAVIVAAANGTLDEDKVSQVLEWVSNNIPYLIGAITLEDIFKNFKSAPPAVVPEEKNEWTKV